MERALLANFLIILGQINDIAMREHRDHENMKQEEIQKMHRREVVFLTLFVVFIAVLGYLLIGNFDVIFNML